MSAVALAAAVWAGGASAGAGGRLTLTVFEHQATEQINELRASYGLRPLTFSPALFESAETHCAQMLAGGYFGHRSTAGGSFAARLESLYPIDRAGYYAVGENLLWNAGPLTSGQIIGRWMRSSEHRRNLLNPAWRQIGLATLSSPSAPGVFDGLSVTVVTADFGVRS